MSTQTLDPKLQELRRGRHIATLATENADGSMHLTAVWYLFEDGAKTTSVKTGRTEQTATTTPKIILATDMMESGNVALNLDLARPGVKTGPYEKR